MPAINSDTAAMWQSLANDLSKERPAPGKRVECGGRKHKGEVGTVVRHMLSRFSTAYRYMSDASRHMADMRGTRGWVVQVRTDAGELFWIDADKVTILPTV